MVFRLADFFVPRDSFVTRRVFGTTRIPDRLETRALILPRESRRVCWDCCGILRMLAL
jgi:hypothetical protein